MSSLKAWATTAHAPVTAQSVTPSSHSPPLQVQGQRRLQQTTARHVQLGQAPFPSTPPTPNLTQPNPHSTHPLTPRRCEGSATCSLHLHGMSSWDSLLTSLPSVYTNPTAPGVIMSSGNVGPPGVGLDDNDGWVQGGVLHNGIGLGRNGDDGCVGAGWCCCPRGCCPRVLLHTPTHFLQHVHPSSQDGVELASRGQLLRLQACSPCMPAPTPCTTTPMPRAQDVHMAVGGWGRDVE